MPTSNVLGGSEWPPGREPVAIVGMSFRFGGDATSQDGFWDMITNGRCAVAPTPKDRFNAEAFYHPDTNRLDRLPIQHGHFLEENIAAFDAPFFNIKAAEAAAMDPQSRKLLEATYRALENAGIPIEKCAGSKTCVFTGVSSDDYRLMYTKDVSFPIRHAATGMALSMLANKISWFYDFKGPSVQLDTACSATLNATHLAVRSIQSGEAEMGIVGGANLYFTPESLAPLAHLNFFSPDSRCYSFDHRANGYSRGDGYGVLVLKPLSRALADHDPIRAVIHSSASNENGRTPGGITKVNFAAQRDMIREAYAVANLDPAATRYVEAHAPGTQGDIVETSALASILSKHRTLDEPLFMGSVKANVGHLEGTSGIASLVKVVLMLEKGIIPKLANFEKLHPDIKGNEWNMKFPTSNILWPPGIRQASINSFGFGGANAHVVLRDGRTHLPQRVESREGVSMTAPYVIILSTAGEAAMDRLLSDLTKYTQKYHNVDQDILQSLVYTLNERRSRLAWRSSIVVFPKRENVMEIDFSQAKRPVRILSHAILTFVFTGQGATWPQMGTQLLLNTVFKNSLTHANDCLTELGAKWNLLEELAEESEHSSIQEAQLSQPISTALQIALYDMLSSFGLSPTYVIGHSSGEIAAAYASGAISAKSAYRLAYFRGLIAAQYFVDENHYGMLVASISDVEVRRYIDTVCISKERNGLYIACINSPRSVTISGDSEQLQLLQHTLEQDSIWCRRLDMNVPYHSPLLDAASKEYLNHLGDLEAGHIDTRRPQMISSVTSQLVSAAQLQENGYWVANLVSTVQFKSAVERLLSALGKDVTTPCFVEVGPSGALRGPTTDVIITKNPNSKPTYLSLMQKNNLTTNRLYESLGELACLGFGIDLAKVNGIGNENATCLTDLPEYPFDNGKSYWHESIISRNHRFRKHARHDLLGNRVLDWNQLLPRWHNCIRTLENPWIEDHRIGGALIYPGAGMLITAIEAVAQYIGDIDDRQIEAFQITHAIFHSALNLNKPAEGTFVDLTLEPGKETFANSRVPVSFRFRLDVREESEHREVCSGTIAVELSGSSEHTNLSLERGIAFHKLLEKFASLKSQCDAPITSPNLYRRLDTMGLQLGPAFQVFDNVRYDRKGGLALAKINLTNWKAKDGQQHASPHFIHPTALDGLIQLLFVALSAGSTKQTPSMVPSRIQSLWLSTTGLHGTSHITGIAQSGFTGMRHTSSEVLAVNDSGDRVQAIIKGLETAIIETGEAETMSSESITAFHIINEPSAICSTPPLPLSLGEVVLKSRILVCSAPLDSEYYNAFNEVAGQTHEELLKIGFENVTTLSPENTMRAKDFVDITKKLHIILIHQKVPKMHQSGNHEFNIMSYLIHICDSITWISLSPTKSDTEFKLLAHHAPIVGLTRTLRYEFPNKQFITMSVAHADMCDCLGEIIVTAFQPHRLSAATDYEPELHFGMLNNTLTFQVPRLQVAEELATAMNKPEIDVTQVRRALYDISQPPLQLTMTSPGLLDSLVFGTDDTDYKQLLPTEVLIRPEYVGLNFLDVLTALGRIPQNKVLGIEGAGIVVQANSTSGLHPGDRVGLLGDGTLRTLIKVDYRTVVKLPDNISTSSAASMIGTASTVYRSFVDIAQLQPGERVLIHAGAGATGQMAIQLAKYIGAEIFATVGSEHKRKLLNQTYGVSHDHIFNSRDASFIQAIHRATDGKKIDVVLNSLSGSLLERSWSEIVAPFGRWIEIGKRDIIDNQGLPMRPFLDNVSFCCIDLVGIWRQRPQMMQRLLQNVVELISKGIFQDPMPVTEFHVADIQDAFRTLQSNKQGGKIIINMSSTQQIEARQRMPTATLFRKDCTYLIVGGFGGLGREVARWMARHGVRSLAIISRSGAGSSDTNQSLLRELAQIDCSVFDLTCDVSDQHAIESTLITIQETLPPLAGCIHASMVLHDKFFVDMQSDDWTDSTAAKIRGSFYLTELLPSHLDFTIFLSSLVGVAGGLGQANYAAGCAYQDALARGQSNLGRKCVSIDLGMIVDAGVVSENETLQKTLQSYGHYQPMTMSHLERLLGYYCDPELGNLSELQSQIVCGIRPATTLQALGFKLPTWMELPMFEAVRSLQRENSVSDRSNAQREDYRDLLQQAGSREEAIALIVETLRSKLSRSLGMDEADLDISRPIHLYGVDSLVAAELRNWFANKLKADVAVMHILGDTNVEALAALVADSSLYTQALLGVMKS